MKSVNDIEEGNRVKIVKIDAGRGLSRKLNGMGIFVGDTIRVLQNTKGPVIIAKDDLRFALGRGMSFKIMVENI